MPFFHVDLDSLALDVEPESNKEAHVEIGDPHERQPCDQRTDPPVDEQSVTAQGDGSRCDVMAEAVLTREDIEELARRETTALLTLAHAPVVHFGKYLLVRDRPGDARDRRREHEQPHDLCRKREIRSSHASGAVARLAPLHHPRLSQC